MCILRQKLHLKYKHNAGYSLFETLLATIIGMLLCIISMHHLLATVHIYLKIQPQLKLQQQKLLAKHYLKTDLYAATHGVFACNVAEECATLSLLPATIENLIDANSIQVNSSILLMQHLDYAVIYYLRKSAIPGESTKFALYRDDTRQNALSLIEDLVDLQVQIIEFSYGFRIVITLLFSDHKPFEITCILNHATTHMS